MCLIVFGLHAHPRYPLVMAANRDEFVARPSEPAAFWQGYDGLLAGRDLAAGGTWMGVTRSGRFAALTNVRDPRAFDPAAPTRGETPEELFAPPRVAGGPCDLPRATVRRGLPRDGDGAVRARFPGVEVARAGLEAHILRTGFKTHESSPLEG